MITVDRKLFTDAFHKVAQCVPSRTDKDVLKCVLLEASEKGTALRATNGTTHIEWILDVTTKPFQTLLPAAKLSAILKEIASESIELGLEKNGALRLKCGQAEFKLQTQDAAEFPAVPLAAGEVQYRVAGADLRKMIRQTAFAVDEDSTRYCFGGTRFLAAKDRLTLVATDSRRLCVTFALCGGGDEKEASIPPMATKLIGSSIDESEVAFSFPSQDSMVFQQGSVLIGSQILSGRFPDYRKVVPTDDRIKNRCSIPSKPFASIVRQANLITNQESCGIDLLFREGELRVSSEASEIGSSKVTIPLAYPGPEMAITLDGRYLAEYLRSVDGEWVDVGLIDAEEPVTFKVGDYTHVIMPLAKD